MSIMEKNSIAVKIEKIRKAIEAGENETALEIAKTVDSARLKSVADVSVLAEAYYRNSDFETALLYFEQMYQKTKTRRILINLINLCLKLSMADMAESYLRDFVEMAPQDFYRHIFRYRIDKLRGEELDVLIFDLELLRDENYMEDWAYELAKLYHKSGQQEKCIAECDDIILWFGSGICVERARALRAYYLSAQSGHLSEKDEALAREVRRLVTAGRTAEEVENFIEETTTEAGVQGEYSEEEYRNARYGKPVYEEEGKDVVWKTKEFGAVSEEEIRMQNTMDLLKGMQVAQQIRMTLGENQEFVLEQPEAESWTEEAEVPEEAEQPDYEGASYEVESFAEPSEQRAEFEPEEAEVPEETEQPDYEGASYEVESFAEPSEQRAEFEPEETEMVSEAWSEQLGTEEAGSWAEKTEQPEQLADEAQLETALAAELQLEEMSEKEVPSNQSVEREEYEYPDEVVLRYYPEEGTELGELLQERKLSLNDFFAGFLINVTVRKQLIRALEQLFDSRYKNISLIVTGEERSGKTSLAKAIAKSMQALGRMASPRVAIISAEKLNAISLHERKHQLENTTLIIEHAGELSEERAEELLAMKTDFAGSTAIILEDERTRMNQLLRGQVELNGEYSNRIHLPKWSVDDVYMQMLSRFVEKEYRMECVAAGMLKERVQECVKRLGSEAYGEMLNYVEKVMERAETRMSKELKQFAIAGNYRDVDLMLIRQEDMMDR